MKQIEFERRYQAFWQECEEQFTYFMRQSSKAQCPMTLFSLFRDIINYYVSS